MSSDSKRNKTLDFMSAIGIIFVIFGHGYQPPFLFYPAFAFHMALFFFISGYFSKTANGIRQTGNMILKKARSQLAPYFILNILFGLLSLKSLYYVNLLQKG